MPKTLPEEHETNAALEDVDLETGNDIAKDACTENHCSSWYTFGHGYKSKYCRNAAFSFVAVNAVASALAINCLVSILSCTSVASVASVNSALSIGSVNSVLSVGCVGQIMKICL